jgi:hypothetical protein
MICPDTYYEHVLYILLYQTSIIWRSTELHHKWGDYPRTVFLYIIISQAHRPTGQMRHSFPRTSCWLAWEGGGHIGLPWLTVGPVSCCWWHRHQVVPSHYGYIWFPIYIVFYFWFSIYVFIMLFYMWLSTSVPLCGILQYTWFSAYCFLQWFPTQIFLHMVSCRWFPTYRFLHMFLYLCIFFYIWGGFHKWFSTYGVAFCIKFSSSVWFSTFCFESTTKNQGNSNFSL